MMGEPGRCRKRMSEAGSGYEKTPLIGNLPSTEATFLFERIWSMEGETSARGAWSD